jgi:hypothetical protein
MAKMPEAALRVDQGAELLATYEWNSAREAPFFPPLWHLRVSLQARRIGSLRRQHLLPRRLRCSLTPRARDRRYRHDVSLR